MVGDGGLEGAGTRGNENVRRQQRQTRHCSGGTVSKRRRGRRRGRLENKRAACEWERGTSGQEYGCGWMRERGGAGAQKWEGGGMLQCEGRMVSGEGWKGRHQRQRECPAAADQALQAMKGGAVSKRRRGRFKNMRAGRGSGRGRSGQEYGCGWMREGGGAGAQKWEGGGFDTLGTKVGGGGGTIRGNECLPPCTGLQLEKTSKMNGRLAVFLFRFQITNCRKVTTAVLFEFEFV